MYHLKTQKAQVIDYTKVPKTVQGQQLVESVNQYGHKIVRTDETTIIKQSTQYQTVKEAAIKLVPSIKGQQVYEVESVTKSKTVEYTIVTVDKGVVSQVVVQFNPETQDVVLLSNTEEPIATEVLKVIKTTQTETTKITVEEFSSTEMTEITSEVVLQNPEKFDKDITIVTGTVQ